MIATVAAAIEASAFDDGVKWQLADCLPMLDQAIGNSAVLPDGLTIAAATPQSGIVFNAKDGWPHIDTTTDTTAQHARKAVGQTVYAAIESATYQGATILNGLTSMLGPPGVTAADAALSRIAGTGQTPMMVVLAVRTEQQITMLVTTAGLAARVLH
jgi:hypothetical protein